MENTQLAISQTRSQILRKLDESLIIVKSMQSLIWHENPLQRKLELDNMVKILNLTKLQIEE